MDLPAAVASDALLIRIAPSDTGLFRYLLEGSDNLAMLTVLDPKKALFKLLFMRNRAGETVPEKDELGDWTQSVIQSSTGLDGDEVKLFHLEMWAYVHGIASMLATGFIDLDWELISRMLTDAYQGLRKQYVKEEMLCTL